VLCIYAALAYLNSSEKQCRASHVGSARKRNIDDMMYVIPSFAFFKPIGSVFTTVPSLHATKYESWIHYVEFSLESKYASDNGLLCCTYMPHLVYLNPNENNG
jgi:hypothetical protein